MIITLESLSYDEIRDLLFEFMTTYPKEIFDKWGAIIRTVWTDRHVFYLDFISEDEFSIGVKVYKQNICTLEFKRIDPADKTSHIITLRIAIPNKENMYHEIKGIYLRETGDVLIDYVNLDELQNFKDCNYVWAFMKSLYDKLHNTMSEKWKLLHEQHTPTPVEEPLSVTTLVPIFDHNVLTNGSLIQLNILKESEGWVDGLWEVGKSYNAFVRENRSTRLLLSFVGPDGRVIDDEIDVYLVTEGYISITKLA